LNSGQIIQPVTTKGKRSTNSVIDLFSRKLVAWEVHAREGGDEAAALMERACWREHRPHNKPLVLHADNGAAQKAHTLKSKLQTLGITPSQCDLLE